MGIIGGQIKEWNPMLKMALGFFFFNKAMTCVGGQVKSIQESLGTKLC